MKLPYSRKRPWRMSGHDIDGCFLIDSRGRRHEKFTGKQFRRVMKALRREKRLKEARNAVDLQLLRRRDGSG